MTNEKYSSLFSDESAPLGTLHAKILIADTLGILGKQTFQNLNLIKHIRNTFAHAVLPIDFLTKQIADACNALVLSDTPNTFRGDPRTSTPLERFVTICEDTSMDLIAYAIKNIKIPAKNLEPNTLVPFPIAALP